MNPNWDYLLTGYGVSVGLFLIYRFWIGGRRRALEREQARLADQGARIDEEG